MDDLALQVGYVDDVEVDDAESADSRCSQVQQTGRAQPAGTDEQHLRLCQPSLPLWTHFGHDEVARVARVARDLRDGRVGQLDRPALLLPDADAAGHGADVLVA